MDAGNLDLRPPEEQPAPLTPERPLSLSCPVKLNSIAELSLLVCFGSFSGSLILLKQYLICDFKCQISKWKIPLSVLHREYM